MILWNFSTQPSLTTLACSALPKMITWLAKQTNNRQANSWGINKLLDNFNLGIVDSEHDITCWIQPVRSLVQHHSRPFIVHHIKIMLPLISRCSLLIKRSDALKTHRITCMVHPLHPGVAFLYPLQTLENLNVFWCSQEVQKSNTGL